jgi:uncharacterized membrane protein
MTEFSSLFIFYAAVQLSGVISFPVSGLLFANLPDKGYSFNKIFGVLTLGFVFWFGSALGIWPMNTFGVWASLLVIFVFSVIIHKGYIKPGRAVAHTHQEKLFPSCSYILATECIFFVIYMMWIIFRGFYPGVEHTEQPMDLMYLNSIWSSVTFPPHDAWLSGYPISYYYFGFWLINSLGRLFSLAPDITYNLGQAAWYALLMIGCFGLVYNLLHLDRDTRKSGRSIQPVLVLGGVFGAICVGFVSTVQGFLDSLNIDDRSHWWWWSASRVMTDVSQKGNTVELINEFPFFSYFIGDNHPHMLAMPFVVLAIALSLNIFLQPKPYQPLQGSVLRRVLFAIPLQLLGLILLSVIVGALIFLNTWDFVPSVMLLILSFYLNASKHGRVSPLRETALFSCILAATILVLFLPYFLTAQSQFKGLAFNDYGFSSLMEIFKVFGFFIPGVILLSLLFMQNLMKSRSSKSSYHGENEDRGASGIESPDQNQNQGLKFLICMAAISIALIVGCEFIYLRDVFGNRMNTIFKFYYHAWLLLGICSGYTITVSLHRRPLRSLGILSFICIALGVFYPANVIWSEAYNQKLGWRGLHASSSLQVNHPDEYAAIQWIGRHTKSDAVVAESPGESYQPAFNRVSAFTGRPTLLGWQEHEAQWRGDAYGEMAAGRVEALKDIYNPQSADQLHYLLSNWRIDYVYVGPAEIKKYNITEEHRAMYGQVMTSVFSNNQTTIYRVLK